VHHFETIEDLRQALHAFKDTYNRTRIVPAQVQLGMLAEAA
jgi:hypothetical protein